MKDIFISYSDRSIYNNLMHDNVHEYKGYRFISFLSERLLDKTARIIDFNFGLSLVVPSYLSTNQNHVIDILGVVLPKTIILKIISEVLSDTEGYFRLPKYKTVSMVPDLEQIVNELGQSDGKVVIRDETTCRGIDTFIVENKSKFTFSSFNEIITTLKNEREGFISQDNPYIHQTIARLKAIGVSVKSDTTFNIIPHSGVDYNQSSRFIVSGFIEGTEYRIIHIGKTLFAEVVTSKDDISQFTKTDLLPINWVPQFSAELIKAIEDIIDKRPISLVGAIDLIVDKNGIGWFIESSPSFNFAGYDLKTIAMVRESFLDMLIKKHEDKSIH